MELPEDHTFRELRFWVNSWTSLSHLFNYSIPPGQEKVKWENKQGVPYSFYDMCAGHAFFHKAPCNFRRNGVQ